MNLLPLLCTHDYLRFYNIVLISFNGIFKGETYRQSARNNIGHHLDEFEQLENVDRVSETQHQFQWDNE